MVLKSLIEKFEYEVINGSDETVINKLVPDSRKVSVGDAFVCIEGAVSDGHKYIPDVIAKGAKAVIVQKNIEITKEFDGVTIIKTEDTRKALAYMSAAFFGYPADELFTIGITGTKGKTTTTYMIREVLESCGIKTGLIGTVEIIFDNDERIQSKNTTPESYDVHRYFRKMADMGCKCVVMEVSSQALMLHRTAGIQFDIGAFTNLEPDHIGPNEHTSFEHYAECKSMLFKQSRIGVVNTDCEHLDLIMDSNTCELVETYGLSDEAGLSVKNISYSHNAGDIATEFDVTGKSDMHVNLSMPGKFSVYNALCAIAIINSMEKEFSVDREALLKGLKNVRVPGRIELVKASDDYIVIIDYAHNAMSLESLLTTLREYNPKRIVTIFGCGGNRSQLRRFEMGEVSGKLSDLTIITSDNPRDEEPVDIMNDIRTGVLKTSGEYVMIEDRGEAVKYAIDNGKTGDIIVIAGKGHEDYQEIKGIKYHMTDRELVNNAIV